MKNETIKLHRHEEGVALLISIFSVLFVALIISASFLFISFTTARNIRNSDFSMKSYYVAEGGMEDLLLRSAGPLAMPSSATSTLTVGTGVATRNVTTFPGGSRRFTSEGNVSTRVRKVVVNQSVSRDTIQFPYGVQVGDLGLRMENNSSITGSVYSNGNVIGDAGVTISQDVIVAGTALTLDANWTVQNIDFSFGNTSSGNVVTVVDSAGDVGSYDSLAIGSDGFARISYYDNTNDDLKFVRCLDADCITKNITTVDSVGDVGWRYTSIALGLDGFARISYHDATNKDLKFARCTNADCTTRNITVLDTPGTVGEFSSLALGLDGFARIAYYAVSGGNLKFIQCTNADCTTRNTTTIDSPNDVGKYTSIAVGSDGFARISYLNETSDDLKFVRCTTADCSTNIITVVDSAPEIEWNTSIILGSDGFARISYYEDSPNFDIRFVRCTNADCTTRNITTVDSAASVGRYSSIELGSDGFPRMSYYDSTNGSVKFARCLDVDCTTRTISVPDTLNDAGHYTSLAMGPDDLARISHHVEAPNYDLRFIRCTADDCAPTVSRADMAQRFSLSTTSTPGRVSLFLRKVGSPPNMTIRIVKNDPSGPGPGKPSSSGSDIVATGTLISSSVGTSYGWVDVNLTVSNPLIAGTPYWILADASLDASNYWVWGGDSTDGYTNGTAMFSADWVTGVWSNLSADLDFRVWIGGSKIEDVTIGNATTGTGRAQQFINTTIHGSACPNPFCIVDSPSAQPFPISTSTLQSWKDAAEAGGVITGDYAPPINSTTTLGPVKITGNLDLKNNQTFIVSGTIWVVGNIDIDNGSVIKLDPAYGALSGVVVTDGWIHIKNNSQFQGSGQAGSYLMMLTTLNCVGDPLTTCTHHNASIDLHNNANGVIFYTENGLIFVHQNVTVTELVARKIELDQNAVLIYEEGLANALFAGGVSGASNLRWEETY